MSNRRSRRKSCPHSKCKRTRPRPRTRTRADTGEIQLSPKNDSFGLMCDWRKEMEDININIGKQIYDYVDITRENPDNCEKTLVYDVLDTSMSPTKHQILCEYKTLSSESSFGPFGGHLNHCRWMKLSEYIDSDRHFPHGTYTDCLRRLFELLPEDNKYLQ